MFKNSIHIINYTKEQKTLAIYYFIPIICKCSRFCRNKWVSSGNSAIIPRFIQSSVYYRYTNSSPNWLNNVCMNLFCSLPMIGSNSYFKMLFISVCQYWWSRGAGVLLYHLHNTLLSIHVLLTLDGQFWIMHADYIVVVTCM